MAAVKRPRDSYRSRVWDVLGSVKRQLPQHFDYDAQMHLDRIMRSAWFKKNFPQVPSIRLSSLRGSSAYPYPWTDGKCYRIQTDVLSHPLDLYVQLAHLLNFDRQDIAYHGPEFSRALLNILKRWDKGAYSLVYEAFREKGVKTRAWSPEAKAKAKVRKVKVDPEKTKAGLMALLDELRG